jgi:branched-subunit amino acid aminotransferase/4-amino-4-deoxychorismate lyase
LDDDGTAWYPSPSEGALDSISLASIEGHLEREGIPLIPGRLTRNLLSRARSLVAIGTGIGVSLITELDGQSVGNNPDDFANLCLESFHQALESGWTDIREESQ